MKKPIHGVQLSELRKSLLKFGFGGIFFPLNNFFLNKVSLIFLFVFF